MKPWRQTKTYPCVRCGVEWVLHDAMHKHVLFYCRERVSKERLLAKGKSYEPATERMRE